MMTEVTSAVNTAVKKSLKRTLIGKVVSDKRAKTILVETQAADKSAK